MITEPAQKNFRRCPDGVKHELTYQKGRGYQCERCDFQCTKDEMKKATD